jgi:ferrochelatase
VLLVNVGSPDAPTARAVRPYLAQFLGDPRVIELPAWLWQPLLHGVLLNTRPRKSARLYQNIWGSEGSPLVANLRKQASGVGALLTAALQSPVAVEIGLRYGNPSVAEGLRKLRDRGVQRLVIFPMFPQYSATTTATAFDAVFDELKQWRHVPALRTIQHYYNHPAYIKALAATIRETWQAEGRAERLLFSFHGIPKNYADKGDPYPDECRCTAALLAQELGIGKDEYALSFQSRLGPIEWLRPYTDETVTEWGSAGTASVQALCPGFSADCLETVDEVGREAAHTFKEAGGGAFTYIPALNDRADHLQALTQILLEAMEGWVQPAPT